MRATRRPGLDTGSRPFSSIFLSYKRVIGLAVGDAHRLALLCFSVIGGRSRHAADFRDNPGDEKSSTSANMCEHSRRMDPRFRVQERVISRG